MAEEVLDPERGDPLLGTVVGERYRIEELLATGGMGRVYRAVQLSVGRPVALKTVNLADLHDRRALQRFYTEAQAASRLSGPHVVRLYDFDVEAETGVAYLTMELAEGPTLRALLADEGSLPLRRAADLAHQMALALCEAHAAGVVHRDLKPENVLVERGPGGGEVAKVADFGLARILDDDRLTELNATTLGRPMGTPPYMAPEQARGRSADGGADLYALGCILHEMLAGTPPLSVDEAMDRPLERKSWPIPPLPDPLPAADEPVPGALALLHAGLLQPRVRRRIIDPDAVAKVLAAIRDGRDIDAEAELTGRSGAKGQGRGGDERVVVVDGSPDGPSRRRGVLAACGFLGGLALLGVLVGMGWVRGDTALPDVTPAPAAESEASSTTTSAPDPRSLPEGERAAPPAGEPTPGEGAAPGKRSTPPSLPMRMRRLSRPSSPRRPKTPA